MSVRGKFRVWSVTHFAQGTGVKVEMHALYDTSVPEDRRYAEATPSGNIIMQVNNPQAIKELAVGKEFYVDFVPVSG
jgi:hypothetical protein